MEQGEPLVDLLLLVVTILGEAALPNDPEQNGPLPGAGRQRHQAVSAKEGSRDSLLLGETPRRRRSFRALGRIVPASGEWSTRSV